MYECPIHYLSATRNIYKIHDRKAHSTEENRVQQSWRGPNVDVGNAGSHLQLQAHNSCTFTSRSSLYTYISSKLQVTTETEQTTRALLQVLNETKTTLHAV